MYTLARSALFKLDPETAHHAGLAALRTLGASTALAARWRTSALGTPRADLSVELAGMRFDHPVAMAAGMDKDAVAVAGLFACGFSSVEVGTLTPLPQPGNPKPRLFRMPEHQAVINRMGFNNGGAQAAAARLRALSWRPGPVGVNIGKNKDTPLERAVDDYVKCVDALAALGDYVVVNASSPNTPGLRKLQEPEALAGLLRAVQDRLGAVAPGKPLFLKIAPDLTGEAVDEVVDVALACRLAGLVCTNTTLARPFAHRHAQEAGGLSGAPVREPANVVLRRAAARAAGRLALVGVGGVFTADDVLEKLRAGASLVQVYTGFIYEGPGMVKRILRDLDARLAAEGVTRLRDLIGKDVTQKAA